MKVYGIIVFKNNSTCFITFDALINKQWISSHRGRPQWWQSEAKLTPSWFLKLGHELCKLHVLIKNCIYNFNYDHCKLIYVVLIHY